MNKPHEFTIILFLLAIVCGDVHTVVIAEEISASAAAERRPDGTITTRKATKSEVENLEQFRKSVDAIDYKYPGPQIPQNANTFKVKAVDDRGTITLENGQMVLMEGVTCSIPGTTYLRKLLAGEYDRVVYTPSSSGIQNPVRAYIWHVDLSLMTDPELKKFEFGPAYSPLNEIALTSDWCVAERSSSNAYNDRYEALSRIAIHGCE